MKKNAWPWIGSEEMGSMSPKGDYKDIQNYPYQGYDALTPVKYIHEEQAPESGGEGMRASVAPSISDIQKDEEEALRSMVEDLRNLLEENMTLGASGDSAEKLLRAFEDKGLNILVTGNESGKKKNSGGFYTNGSSMFHKFSSKLNGFILSLESSSPEQAQVSIRNFADQLAFSGAGVIISSDKSLDAESINKAGLNILSHHDGVFSKFLVKSCQLEKVAVARCYNEKAEEVASFLCDIADTQEKKIDGLQVYSKLKEQCGLLFTYKRASDVMYHMGSVSYPIDIVFVDNNAKIKKIAKNVLPGSLDVHSCSSVTNVLEVAGGMCDILNIKEGFSLYVTAGEGFSDDLRKAGSILNDLGSRRFAFKKSASEGFSVLSGSIADVVRVNKEISASSSDIIQKFGSKNNDLSSVTVLDADAFISTLGDMRLYASVPPSKTDRIYTGIHRETFSIENDSFANIPASTFFKKDAYQSLNKKYSYASGLSGADSLKESHMKMLKKLAFKPNLKLVIASRSSIDKELFETFLEESIRRSFGVNKALDSEEMRIPSGLGTKGLYRAVVDRYSIAEVYANALIKEGGIPVPEKTKSKAREALKYIERSSRMCEEITSNLEQNLEAYNKVKGNADAVKGSKGKYNESCKRNSRILKRALLNIKSSIQILNSIRDISTTAEVISAIAEASKVTSSSASSIFDLVRTIESDDFIEKLDDLTAKCVSSLEDTKMTLSRAKDYINSDILGIVVLTE